VDDVLSASDAERVLGAPRPDTPASRNNLAYAYETAGRVEQTIPLHVGIPSARRPRRRRRIIAVTIAAVTVAVTAEEDRPSAERISWQLKHAGYRARTRRRRLRTAALTTLTALLVAGLTACSAQRDAVTQ
jgi:hypothetical protein